MSSSSPSSTLRWESKFDWRLPSDLTLASDPVTFSPSLRVFGDSVVTLQARRKVTFNDTWSVSFTLTEANGSSGLQCEASITLKHQLSDQPSYTSNCSRLPLTLDYTAFSWAGDIVGVCASFRIAFIKVVDQAELTVGTAVTRPMTLAEFGAPLLGDTELSDVVVVAGDRTFHCHKVILARQSAVFKAMITGKFREADENRIEIRGFGPNVTEQLLKFIYTDQAPADEAISWELFNLAKMYDVVRLQAACVAGLNNTLTVDNVCQVLEMAHFYELPDLFAPTKSFFKANIAKVRRTDGWRRILDNDELAEKLLTDS